ncbi:conserved hypothetical protein [uncultured Eubacteriales bacterium]|uniref:Uncharacterized protein n=1 Tax=uncultured Eubacteriales bacterium TaxID=172733 RepID=A0A212JKE3_9FIRM|nr:conserved hypothetical protein [uncultured Eubacteriales bacterium]
MARNTRSAEDRISEINTKIEKKKSELTALENQKYKLEHPLSMRDVLSKAKEAGLSAHDVADKLGIKIE